MMGHQTALGGGTTSALWRLLSVHPLGNTGTWSTATSSVTWAGCLDKFNKFRDGINKAKPATVPKGAGVPDLEARWAGDRGDPGEEEPGDSSSDSGATEEDDTMKGKIAELKAQLKKAEHEALERSLARRQ